MVLLVFSWVAVAERGLAVHAFQQMCTSNELGMACGRIGPLSITDQGGSDIFRSVSGAE